MRKQRFFLSAGVVGLGMALAATPVAAQTSLGSGGTLSDFTLTGDAEPADEGQQVEVSGDAIGTFSGFSTDITQAAIVSKNLTVEVPTDASAKDLLGSLVDPSPELIVRDDIGIDGSVDVTNSLPSVVQLFLRDNGTGGVFFNCTGTLINPRTVLTAAHCVNSNSSEAFGTSTSGPLSVLVGTGVGTQTRAFNTIFGGANYAQGGLAQSSDVIIHASSEVSLGGFPFPLADVALIALDEPITDIPAMPILLTPLDQLTHVLVAGYGTNGTGELGGINTGSPFLRRIGENMLGAISSSADLIDNVAPALAPTAVTIGQITQSLYFIDFDNPNRAAPGEDSCTFTGTAITCPNFQTVTEIDWFDGDALPQEAGTAPGDSGSPIIVDELYDRPVVAGVLSGGFDFFGVGNRYSDISFYNPLFPFFEFISENTPYKYVSTVGGDGNWSDPNYWTQDLDPGFFVDDGSGNLVNGVPTGSEQGIFATGPKIGTILGNDISGASTDVSPFFPPPGTPNFGANTPDSSVLLGPGSTGFVPNNTDGTPGVAFADPAQYFDVLLTNSGTTTVDMNVEIDRLTIDNNKASFLLPEGFDFNSIIGIEQYRGKSFIDGSLNAGLTLLFGGRMMGFGEINTPLFFNVAGRLAPGRYGKVGTLTINGDYLQTSGGILVINADVRKGVELSDLLVVNGTAVLDGTLFILGTKRIVPEFGSTFTVLSADSIVGDFQDSELISKSTLLQASSRVEGNDVIVEIGARKITDLILGDDGIDGGLGTLGSLNGGGLMSLANTLDTLRFSGRYNDFRHVFGVLDNAGWNTFGATLASLAPSSAFTQSMTANNFAQRFTGQIAQRTLALRGAGNAAAGFSAAGNASFAQAGTQAAEPGKLGFFGSVSGSFLNTAEDDLANGATAIEQAAFTQAGEMTLGTDYRVSNNVAVGVAISNIRNSSNGVDGFQPLEDESVSIAAYAAADMGKGFADMYFGYSSQNYGMQRAARGDFVQAFRSALGSAEGTQTFAGMRVGYTMQPAKGLTVGPVASLDYVRSDLDGYQEFGAGQFGLNIHNRTFTSLGAKVGAMAAADLNIGQTGKLTAFGSVAYARELADTQDVITASFIGAEDLPFTLSNPLDGDWVSVNAGAELSLSDRLSTRLNVSSDMGRGVLSNDQARVSLNWKF